MRPTSMLSMPAVAAGAAKPRLWIVWFCKLSLESFFRNAKGWAPGGAAVQHTGAIGLRNS